MNDRTLSTNGYGSYLDLPEVQEMLRQIQGAKLLTTFIARDHKKNILDIENRLQTLANQVDTFYATLGDRNWIYSGQFNTGEIEEILNESASPAEAEERLIGLYRDPETLHRWINGLKQFDSLRSRLHLIERAAGDYYNDRFDVCALMLTTVMDGFVNDHDPSARKGLHARRVDEMVAWNSVVGHHKGLAYVFATFVRPVKKPIHEEVLDLYRNGIVHGTVTNYNNAVVATKAWNMLFAVADWARSDHARNALEEPKPTWSETLSQVSQNRLAKEQMENFTSSTLYSHEPGFMESESVRRSEELLAAWQKKQYGLIAMFESRLNTSGRSKGAQAGALRCAFEPFDLSDFELESVHHRAVAASVVYGTATVNGTSGRLEMLWIYQRPDGRAALGNEQGEWRMSNCSPCVWKRRTNDTE